jgi:hypothetical protein
MLHMRTRLGVAFAIFLKDGSQHIRLIPQFGAPLGVKSLRSVSQQVHAAH